MLFADVTGSTAIAERLDPEHVTEVMETFFAAMREEIAAEGGTVEKFIGDAVVAVFGVPSAHEDDPARAVRAALRMQRRLERVNAHVEPTHGVSLRIRIGVNTGEVLAAIDAKPGEPSVTGDAVNVAARLEQAAQPGQVVVSERTARAARGFRYRPLGDLELRGRAAETPALVVEGRAAIEERGLPGLHAPMIGRDRELALLRTVFDRAAEDARPHLVTVYGQPGVGKSRLVSEFLAVAEALDARPTVLRGRCLPYGEGVTYWPLAEILKSRGGVEDTDSPEVALGRIRRLGRELQERTPLGELPTETDRVSAALAYTIGVDDPEIRLRDLTPRQVHAEMDRAWRVFFSALATEAPLIVIVEDIHWADGALLDLLEEIAERAEGPIVLVCPSRPELTERRPAWGGGQRNFSSIVLEPLPLDDADRLTRTLLAVEDLPAALHRRILERAEGNPFFLEEILRQLIDEGHVVRDGDAWRCRAEPDEVSIPDTVQAVLAARIDLLDRVDKHALQHAAVIGRVFWPGPLARILNGLADHLDDALGRLERRDFVQSRLGSTMAGEPEYSFKHALIRDVAYESMPRRERPGAHAAVAGWIEEQAGDRRLEFVELLAFHYLEAYSLAAETAAEPSSAEQHRRKAFEYLLLASGEARSKLALGKARQLAEQGVSVAGSELERALAFEALGEACVADFRGDDAWRSFRAAADARLGGTPDDRRAIAYICARAVEVPTRWPGVMRDLPTPDEVRPYLATGLEHAGPGDSPERVRLLTARSMLPFAFFYQGVTDEELESARLAGEEAADMALRLDQPDLASGALDGLQSVYAMSGRYGAGAEPSARRLALAPRLTDSAELGDLHSSAAWTSFHVGRYREAAELAERGAAAALPDAPSFGMHCLVWRVMGLYRLGEWDAAIETHRRLEELLGERVTDPPRPYLRSAAVRALIHEVRGERSAADRQLAVLRSVEDVQQTRSAIGPGWVALTLARRGDFDEARAWLERLRWREGTGLKLEALCDLVAEEERWDEAPQVVQEAREHAAWAGLLALPCFADRLEGRAALASGDPEGAIRALERACDGFSRLEARWERACAELSLAEAQLVAGREPQARRRLESALVVFEGLSSQRELERSRGCLAASRGGRP
jgi:class 3 adenylate cyclase/tetratricopeptide (TPR) repeat protein